MTSTAKWVPLGGLLVFTCLLYARTLSAPFVFDDYATVVNNPAMAHAERPWSFFSDPTTFTGDPATTLMNYRPLSTWSLAMNAKLFGIHPISFRWINLLLHLFNGLLVFEIARRSLRGSLRAAWITMAVFLLHPVQIESVVWITCRSVVLSTAFFLVALLAYIEEGPSSLRLGAFAAALLSKEQTIVLPLVQELWTRLFATSSAKPTNQLTPGETFRRQGAYVTIAAAYVILRSALLHRLGQVGYPGGHPLYMVWTQLKSFMLYLKILIFPYPLTVDYDLPILQHFNISAAGGLVLLGALVACAWVMRRRKPALAFGILFFLIALLPVSGVIPIMALVAERFVYLPVVGISIVVGASLMPFEINSRAWAAVSGLMLCFFVTLSWIRLSDWKEPVRLFEQSLRVSPRSLMLHFGLGLEKAQAGDIHGAEAEFQTCTRIDPSHSDSWLDLARLKMKQGQASEAVPLYRRALPLTKNFGTLYELAVAYRLARQPQKAVVALRDVLTQLPNGRPVRRELALAYAAAGHPNDAINVLRTEGLQLLSPSQARLLLQQLQRLPPPDVEQTIREAALIPA